MPLEDYLLEEEKILSYLSLEGGLKLVATDYRVVRYEQIGRTEAFLDLPYHTITSIGTLQERVTHYKLVVGGLALMLLSVILLLALPLPLFLRDVSMILLVIGIILALIGAFWKETKLSLELRGKEIPDYGERNPWVLNLAKMIGKPEDLAKFTKTVREQINRQ